MADVTCCEIGVVAALTNHDEICVAFVVINGITEAAMLLIGYNLLYSGGAELGHSIFKDNFAMLTGDFSTCRF